MNLQQICSFATQLNQGRLDYSLSEMSFYANLAQTEVATAIQYRALESIAVSSTTSGENRITLPTDFAYDIDLSNISMANWSGQYQLTKVEAQWIDSQSTWVGIPINYAVYSDWMELWPSPDSSYSIQLRYAKKIPSLVSTADSPAIDERFHRGIAYKTAELAAQARNDYEQEAANAVRYQGFMSAVPSDLAFQQRAKPGLHASVKKWGGSPGVG